MKKIIYLTICLFSISLFSQNIKVTYLYQTIPDSTKQNKKFDDIVILNINNGKSEFYSERMFKLDSAQVAQMKKLGNDIPPAPPVSGYLSRFRVIKTKQSESVFSIDGITQFVYKVEDKRKINWKLLQEYDTVLNYKVQKATTVFGGRRWTAWFTKEIPIPDGPYKFRGLPGLILKIEDATGSHIFEAKSISNETKIFEYPKSEMVSNIINISQEQFKKLFQKNRENPTEHMDYLTADQRREYDNFFKESFKSDNNLIEIDLLKGMK